MTAPVAYHERECKLDAPSDDVILQVKDYVLAHAKIFTPALHQNRAGIPGAMRPLFTAPMEVTEPRIRLYWDDAGLTAQKNGIEIRQEPRPKGGIKQMVKISVQDSGAVLNRMEHAANLDHFGIDLDAIKDSDARHDVKKILDVSTMKPIICMVSQRTRLNYHPDGDTSVLIELGFDAPCWGCTFDKFQWKIPQIELELLEGPDDDAAISKLLKTEMKRLQDRFDLTPNTTSKPSQGFAHVRGILATPEGHKAFEVLEPKEIWWV